jgi:hypothetical protein
VFRVYTEHVKKVKGELMAEFSKKQSWWFFTQLGYDIRESDLTQEEVSDIIGFYKNPEASDMTLSDQEICDLIEQAGGVKKSDSTPKPKQDWKALYDKAHEAGVEAAKAKIPEPMVVVERANPLDDSSAIVKQYEPVLDGVCGFAWINIKPGNHSFCNWYKKNIDENAKDNYYGGISIWVHDFRQSMEKKSAYAGTFADVLNNEIDHPKFRAVAMSRID